MMIDLLCFCEVTTDFTAAHCVLVLVRTRTCTAVKQLEVLRSLLLCSRTNVLRSLSTVQHQFSGVYEY